MLKIILSMLMVLLMVLALIGLVIWMEDREIEKDYD